MAKFGCGWLVALASDSRTTDPNARIRAELAFDFTHSLCMVNSEHRGSARYVARQRAAARLSSCARASLWSASAQWAATGRSDVGARPSACQASMWPARPNSGHMTMWPEVRIALPCTRSTTRTRWLPGPQRAVEPILGRPVGLGGNRDIGNEPACSRTWVSRSRLHSHPEQQRTNAH